MSYKEEVDIKINNLKKTLEEEQLASMLSLIKRPDGAKEALEFQYEELDSLSIKTLQKYLGALSQYLIYVTKYVNTLESKKKIASSFYNRKISEGYFKYSDELKNIKSVSEKEIYIKHEDKELNELLDSIENLEAKLVLYSNIPDTINNLIQTLKKVYDARIKESFKQEA